MSGNAIRSMQAWLDNARWYYSEIGGRRMPQPVSVFDATSSDEVSSESPGTLVLRLEPRRRYSPRLPGARCWWA